MKRICLAITALASTHAAFAAKTPRVGDTANYIVQYSQTGERYETSELKKEIIGDSRDGSFTVRWTSASDVINSEVYGDGLLYIDDLKAFCRVQNRPDRPAKLERITVKAGSFETCRLTTTNTGVSSVWYSSEVPFGMVKEVQVFSDKSIRSQELSSFRY